MLLHEHRPDNVLFVRRVGVDSIVVGERTLARSFVLSADRVIEDWPVRAPDQIDGAALECILALTPEVVLLGTGARLRFPPQAVLAAFLTRGIGFESMDNAAAARTYHVMASEGRRVVAAFILDT
jgi:uncharacterized protein